MREIIFRGQTRRYGEKVNMAGEKQPSKWVYGGIFPGTGDFSVIYGAEKEDFTGTDIEKYTVYSGTVGQYTGLTDKNGKRIFEGDIVTLKGKCIELTGKVTFYQGGFELYDWENDMYEILWYKPEEFEVIGNIHDNPELIGGNNED